MRPLLDTDGENRAVRMFLMLYSMNSSVTTKQMKSHLGAAGFAGAWPEWVDVDIDMHLTKGGAQSWLRHLFALEQNIDTSEERVHISDKNVHVQISELTRERDEALRLLAMAHLNIRQHLEHGFSPNTARSTLISVGRIAPLLAERRKVHADELLHKALNELKRVKRICMEEAGIGLCNERLIAELDGALSCEFGEMCLHCNPPKGVSHA